MLYILIDGHILSARKQALNLSNILESVPQVKQSPAIRDATDMLNSGESKGLFERKN